MPHLKLNLPGRLATLRSVILRSLRTISLSFIKVSTLRVSQTQLVIATRCQINSAAQAPARATLFGIFTGEGVLEGLGWI